MTLDEMLSGLEQQPSLPETAWDGMASVLDPWTAWLVQRNEEREAFWQEFEAHREAIAAWAARRIDEMCWHPTFGEWPPAA